MNEIWKWVRRRRLTLGLIIFFAGWYGLQLSVSNFYGKDIARWWFYVEQPPNAISPGIVFAPISHDLSNFKHIIGNILFVSIAGGLAEPYISERKFLSVLLGLGYLGTYLANATAFIHKLWIFAGASGGILALWSYSGLKMRHIAWESKSGIELSRVGIEQITAVSLIIGIPAILLVEGVLANQFHSGHVIGLSLGCLYFGYEYYSGTT